MVGVPTQHRPWWLGWLLYGQLAVAVFIVVSGFSLALAPMRDGARLKGGTRRFLRRRAWQILPAYWAALVLSTVITACLLRPDLGAAAVAKAFVVHGLLLQDVIGSAERRLLVDRHRVADLLRLPADPPRRAPVEPRGCGRPPPSWPSWPRTW